jgi:hypothetical protein
MQKLLPDIWGGDDICWKKIVIKKLRIMNYELLDSYGNMFETLNS